MSALTGGQGVPEAELTDKMDELSKKLSAMCNENAEYRDAVETRVVSLKKYLPLNSKEGMELLFRVSIS